MTDKEKLDKLVAEIKMLRKEVKDNIAELGNSESERIGLFKDLEIYDNILSFIDSMQEEPKECMYSKDNYTDEDRKALCKGCEEECEYNKKEEPVSEDFKIALEKKVREAQDWTYIEEEGGECPLNEEFGACDLEEFAKWGANWQKEQMMKDAVDGTVFIQLEDGEIMVRSHYFKSEKFNYLDEIKLIIIKEE